MNIQIVLFLSLNISKVLLRNSYVYGLRLGFLLNLQKSKELQQLVAQLNQPDPVQIVITNSHHESNAGASKIKPISTRPEVSSPSQSQNNFTSQKATTQGERIYVNLICFFLFI